MLARLLQQLDEQRALRGAGNATARCLRQPEEVM